MPSPRKRAHARQKNLRVTWRKQFILWINYRRKLVAWWLLAIGFLLVTFPSIFKQWTSRNAQPIQEQQPLTNAIGFKPLIDLGPIQIDNKLLSSAEPSQPPLRIVIPEHRVDLSVVEALVIDGFWELSETTASHGVGSANPGEVGNTVIFAHARDELFGPLRNMKKDAIIYVLTKDRWYRYRVSETRLVDPTAIEVVAPTTDETLTLYTCSGFFDTKRLIVVAKPQRP